MSAPNRLPRLLLGQLLGLLLALPAGSVWADWMLDSSRSAINFTSIKNDSVAEVHGFGSLAGYIGGSGNVRVTIELASVQTLIDVRDERLRELLFETVKFPAAVVETDLTAAVLAQLTGGNAVNTEVAVTLSLHGKKQTLAVPVVAISDAQRAIHVLSARPVVVNAADFDLAGGIEALRAVAGLDAISTAVPVTLHLVFTPDG